MSTRAPVLRRMSKTQIGFLAAALAFAVLACTIGAPSVSRQEWLSDRGPVVPHDSFPADCSLCHVGDGWNQIREDFEYDHLAHTGVELEGAHSGAECLRCHNDRGPVEVFAARGCAGCHEDVHRGQLGRDCSTCHGQLDWRPGEQIAMHNRTRFPLVGAHASTGCWRCHPGAQVGNFARADTECITCHASELQRATNPAHVAQGWTDRCDRCHIPTSWTGAGFNHGTWPLTGAHAAINCTQCHPGQAYAGTPRACEACHTPEYNQVQDPNHVALMFPLNCKLCHGTSSWEGAHFNHSGITQACVDCHLAEYQNTGNPNHGTAGFPTSCQNCHNTKSWMGAVFNHSFPINSGAHKKLDCTDCHTNPSSYVQFSCLTCHEHSQSKMNNKHEEVSGYVYQSNACLSCHPNGKH